MRFLPSPSLRPSGDASTGLQRDAGLILKLLALALCYALAAEADARERSTVRVLAIHTAADMSVGASPGAAATTLAAPTSASLSTRYGEPQVLSALGEPLDVRIPLLGDDAAIAAEARFALGHAETRLGLPIVSNANIRVVREAGGWALRVSSTVINDEPALALVIQEKRASGTLSRALPLLFDPAVRAAPAVPAPQQATDEPARTRAANIVSTVPAPAPSARPRPAFVARATPSPAVRVRTPARLPPPLPPDERNPLLRLATTLAPAANPAASHRESMRWLRRALLEDDDRAALLAMGKKMRQLVAQVEEMEARIAAFQPPGVTRTASTADAAAQQPARPSRRPG